MDMQHNEKSFSLKTMEDGQVLLYSVSILVHITSILSNFINSVLV